MKRSALKPSRSSTARRACVEVVLQRAKGRCEWPDAFGVTCDGPVDVHEPLTRARGGDPTDPEQCTAVCRCHHDYAHTHPIEAGAIGLLVHSWNRSTGNQPTEGT